MIPNNIKERPSVSQICHNLSRQSYAAYQDFLNNLRNGNPIPGEREIPNRVNSYSCPLPTGELVVYSVKRERTWYGELQETITIECLIPQEMLDGCLKNQAAAILFREIVRKSNEILNQAQNLIFSIEFLGGIFALLITLFMLWSQSSQEFKPPEKPPLNQPNSSGVSVKESM